MRLFLKRSRGSMTVMVTLIMVPTIFFTSFMVDLARIKLYSNQAVMVADNYGQTVTTYYDNLMKELYGLFAVTQNEDALKQLDVIQGYMTSSFYPNAQQIEWEHFKETRHYVGEKLGNFGEYSGFMPYQDAEISLEYEPVEGANLGNPLVFSSQVGDFMKFRIVQCIGDDGSKLIEALETVKNTKKNAEAIEKRQEISDAAGEVFDKCKVFYEELKQFKDFPGYLKNINEKTSEFETTYHEILNSDEYKAYIAVYKLHTDDKTGFEVGEEAADEVAAYEEAKENWKEGDPEPSEPSDDTKEKAETYNTWKELPNATEAALKKKYNDALENVRGAIVSEEFKFGGLTPPRLDNFSNKVEDLTRKANEVRESFRKIEEIKKELDQVLEDPGVNASVKQGIRNDLKRLEEIEKNLGSYQNLSHYIDDRNSGVVETYNVQMKEFIADAEEFNSNDSAINILLTDYADWDMTNYESKEILDEATLDISKYSDFMEVPDYKAAYDSLEKCFKEGEDGSAEKTANDKKDKANEELKKRQEELSKDETTEAWDVPTQFGYGASGTGSGFSMSSMMKDAANMFSLNGLEQEGEKFLLKFYTVEYDFGMFSSRVTPEKKNEAGEKEIKESLTGYEMSKKINYLYTAELEYLMNGADSSVENLNAARNKILGFRGVMNFAATYQVKEINEAITYVSEAAAAVNPLLGLVVNGALRLAVTGMETFADWEELKKGNEVYVMKTELKQLTAWQDIKNLIGEDRKEADGMPESEPSEFKMDYEDYVMVMMVFLTSMDALTQRTANLVELNVNHVDQHGGKAVQFGSSDSLKIKMDKAVTAVNASCAVHMDFLVMPDSFAQSAASEDTYTQLKEYEKNSYKFTVTRGY